MELLDIYFHVLQQSCVCSEVGTRLKKDAEIVKQRTFLFYARLRTVAKVKTTFDRTQLHIQP